MAPVLLGPPIIRGARPSPTADADAPASHPFLDLLDAGFNDAPDAYSAKSGAAPPKARTENNSATYAGSGNPCLDLFFQVVPNTPADRVRVLVAAALTALKLVANLRGVRGTGKSDRDGFYAAALWIHERHPRTLACNVPALAEFGYLKDFPELLYRLLHGADVRKLAKAKVDADKARKAAKDRAAKLASLRSARAAQIAGLGRGRGRGRGPTIADFVSAALTNTRISKSKRGRKAAAVVPVEIEEPADQAMEVEQKPQAMEVDQKAAAPPQPQEAAAATKKKAVTKKLAPGGKKRKIGLAAKWCPTPGSSFDRSTLLCEAIARRLFPRDSSPDYADMAEEHYSYQTLHRLRREVLVPLRKVLELPEVYMSAQRWSELPYTRVASVAMRRYKALFKKHDEARFGKYLEDVEAGKAKIAAGALLPHEISAAAFRGEKDDVSELQWARMVEDLRKKGSLSNCIAVCDVSGSMFGTPMEVCVALGLLISELSEKPWAGRVITFSSHPEIHMIKGKTLQEKLRFVQRMHWGVNTNFQAVFDRILRTAVDARLAPEKMIRTVFVFSDMEFDRASANRWETDYEAICRKFRSAGYGDVVPQIVFWNLRDSRSTPVTSTQPGVAMVSGFSKNFVKLFLENDGVVNPEAVMAAAIAGEEYQKLAIFD
ncbi:unnamed protein product [Urochloa humidicola]